MNTDNTKSKWSRIISTLLDAGVNYVLVFYNGSGDSGCIEEIEYCKSLEEEILETGKVNSWDMTWNSKDDPDSKNIRIDVKFNDIDVEELFYPTLDNIEDWWNNEGGYGTAVADLKRKTITIDNNIYITNEENHHHHVELTD
jgi:hypothetical protein